MVRSGSQLSAGNHKRPKVLYNMRSPTRQNVLETFGFYKKLSRECCPGQQPYWTVLLFFLVLKWESEPGESQRIINKTCSKWKNAPFPQKKYIVLFRFIKKQPENPLNKFYSSLAADSFLPGLHIKPNFSSGLNSIYRL